MTLFEKTVARLNMAKRNGVNITQLSIKVGIEHHNFITAMSGRSTCSLTDKECALINAELDKMKEAL